MNSHYGNNHLIYLMILYSHTAHTFKIGGLFAADPLTQAGDSLVRSLSSPPRLRTK